MSRPNPQSWPYLIAVALLPLLVLWRDGNALYTPSWYSDPWFYLGGFRDLLEFKRGVFYNSYYASRLSWILPGWAIHSIFSAVLANAVLHLAVHLAATVSLFSILRRAAGVRAALLATLVFSVNPWLWAATGWDYVDGPGIAYCLIAIALLARAAGDERARWPLLVAGVAFAGMIYCNIFWLSLAPLVALTYPGIARPTSLAEAARNLARLALWSGAGFLAATLLLCAVNYRLDGYFWFYAPSVATALKFSQKFVGYRGIWMNGQLGPWLWPVVVGTATAALLALRLAASGKEARRGPAMFFSVQLLLVAAAMAFLQSRGSPVLGYNAYASCMLPFEFLAMGCAFWPAVERMRPLAYGVLCALSALMFAILWNSRSERRIGPVTAPAWIWMAAIAVFFLAALLLRNRTAGPLAAMAGFLALTAVVLHHQFVDTNIHGDREQYTRMMRAYDRIQAVRTGRVVRFWFSERDPNYDEFTGINALFGAAFRHIGTGFPGGCEIGIEPDSLVAALSAGEGTVATARQALTGCWRPMALTPVLESEERIAARTNSYTLAIFRAQIDPTRLLPLRATLHGKDPATLTPVTPGTEHAPLPLEGWAPDRIPGDPPLWTVTPAGVQVRTPRNEFGYTARYATLEAPFAGRFRVSLLARDRRGQSEFGVRDAADLTWMAGDVFGRALGDRHEMSVWVTLNRGERFVLRICNNDLGGRGASSFLMERVTIAGVPQNPL